jgi:hypothetical protein
LLYCDFDIQLYLNRYTILPAFLRFATSGTRSRDGHSHSARFNLLAVRRRAGRLNRGNLNRTISQGTLIKLMTLTEDGRVSRGRAAPPACDVAHVADLYKVVIDQYLSMDVSLCIARDVLGGRTAAARVPHGLTSAWQ